MVTSMTRKSCSIATDTYSMVLVPTPLIADFKLKTSYITEGKPKCFNCLVFNKGHKFNHIRLLNNEIDK